jgi:hypothetical protein
VNVNLKRLTIGLACMAPMAAWSVDPARDVARELAWELVGLMHLEEQAQQKVERQILARCRVEKCDADLRQCLMKPDDSYYMEYVVSEAVQELTPDEMRQAIAYFRTESGLKHLDILRAEQGLGGSDTLFSQDDATRARILAFLDTRAGYLVITRSVLLNSVTTYMNRMAAMAFWRCQPGK